MKSSKIYLLFIIFLFSLLIAADTLAAEAPELPEDNLVTNPWFRDATNTTASHDGWTVGAEWGLSQKNHNPTPDEVQGTSARLGTPKATFGVDSTIEQVIEADPSWTILRFQTWQVSRNLHQAQATVYAGESPDGPWEMVWQPWYEENSSVHWIQTPLVETALVEGFPYYKVEFLCNYWQGTAGCKFTGVYFTASAVSDPAAVAIEDLPPVVSSGGGRGEEAGTDPLTEPVSEESVAAVFEGASATAVSDQEVTLSWPEQEDGLLTIEIERSPDGRRQWRPIGTVSAETLTFTDTELSPETTYYYRLVVRQAGQGRAASEVISVTTAAGGAAPEPTVTPESVAAVPTDTPEPAPEPAEEEPVVESELVETAVPAPTEAAPVVETPLPEPATRSGWVGIALGFIAGMGVAAAGMFIWFRRQS